AGSVVTVSVSGTVQNQPLAVSEVLVYWPLISGLDDETNSREQGVIVAEPKLNGFVLSDGTIVAAYSNLGQVFAVDGKGDGAYWKSGSGPGSNVNRNFYEEFSISSDVGYNVRVDSI